ncbi:acetoin dehydrogenase [Thioalkalivibrio denitrificans]|uniref:Acetoin dehydrogenase n=1 Tax=Thioalkalivibrio denitrificans TaxID=108003 RepID=A0A1V3NJV2_9GAMM|nr:SDR family NAD(P)-dependent oxidoreductase [Thioalkalivibrio denitrificans]OOG25389.1 acetoin dehydrogenase [Thioalkalivibrio denitrificans]
MKNRTSLEGAVSIVTGARGVIGRGIARELADAGSDVVLQVARDGDGSVVVKEAGRAQPLVEEIEALGRKALAVNCDVSNPAQVNAMVERTIEIFGRLDVLVNNAGIVRVCPVESMTDHEWDEVLGVNLKGMFLCCRAAIPHLKASAGAIVNNGSIASFGGAGGLAHYCASKHGVIGLTRALALELAPFDVTVNAICPGIVNTPMWSKVLTPDPEQYRSVIDSVIPLGRDQTPEDMGRAVVFLVTSHNITGQSITVDGGVTCRAT